MISLISAIIVLGVLIFVHELGHFLLCKVTGVGVEKFSLGFGPKLVGWRVGETEYLISAFPLGGYVKMLGEGAEEGELPEVDPSRTFSGKHPFQRLLIIGAGPFFNLFFAALLLIIVFMIGVPAATTKVGEVVKDKPAAKAGIAAGDVITSINGEKVSRWDDVSQAIAQSRGEVAIEVVRNGSPQRFVVPTETRTIKNIFGETTTSPLIGVVSAGEMVVDRFSPPEAVVRGVAQTWNLIKLTILSLVKLAERVVPLDTIGGPIMIAKMAGQQASAGGVSFLAFMALLSINLGILNLLPIPVLDGGHLLFNTLELIFGKPVKAQVREVAQQVGLILLIGLMVLAFYNDIIRYFLGQG